MTGPDLTGLFDSHDAPTCAHPGIVCPHCREHVCSATRTDTGEAVAPAVGMTTVCVFCSLPALFARSPLGVLTLRAPTEREAAEFVNDPAYRRAVAALDRARRAVAFTPSGGGLWTPETVR